VYPTLNFKAAAAAAATARKQARRDFLSQLTDGTYLTTTTKSASNSPQVLTTNDT